MRQRSPNDRARQQSLDLDPPPATATATAMAMAMATAMATAAAAARPYLMASAFGGLATPDCRFSGAEVRKHS